MDLLLRGAEVFVLANLFPSFASLSIESPLVLKVAPQFSMNFICVKNIYILGKISSVKFILSRLAREINIAPNLKHSVVYGTVGRFSY